MSAMRFLPVNRHAILVELADLQQTLVLLGALQAQPDFSEPPLMNEGAVARWNHREDNDYFSQPGNLFRLMTPSQQQVLFDNTARAINGASQAIVERHIANCASADPAYGKGVAEAVARLRHSAG